MQRARQKGWWDGYTFSKAGFGLRFGSCRSHMVALYKESCQKGDVIHTRPWLLFGWCVSKFRGPPNTFFSNPFCTGLDFVRGFSGLFLGLGSKPMGSHFGIGEFTTHFRAYFSGWIGMFTGTIWVLTHDHTPVQGKNHHNQWFKHVSTNGWPHPIFRFS